MIKRVVILARVSSGKQAIEGDNLEEQIRHCREYIKRQQWRVVKIFPLVESGRAKEREYFQEVITYCKDKKNKVDYVVFKNISRFTRGGDKDYLELKSSLEQSGVEIRDVYGSIRPKINTMETYGLKYSWSVYSPSQSDETYQANRARDGVRDALTQMIGAEISYTRKGYWNGTSPFGFNNKKIETVHDGKRNILVERPKESVFMKKMYEMRASCRYSDKQITNHLNKLGFKTRKRCKRDKRTNKVIGYIGERPLTPQMLQRRVKAPVYAGVICEKWTLYQPVRAKFKGLISIGLFNQANKGKVRIIDDGKNLQIKYGKASTGDRRLKNNPLYPYKRVVMCPKCNKPLLGSASRGKMGKKYPGYHCSKGHKYWRVPRDTLHKVVDNFVKNLKFDKAFLKLFEEIFLDVWKEKRADVVKESQQAEKHVSDLLLEQKTILETIKSVTSNVIRKQLEEDFESIENKITEARTLRVEKEKKELDVKLAIKYAVYFMEHLGDLLIDKANSDQQRQLFGLLFEELPNYDDLVSGTPKLAPLFKLNSKSLTSKKQLVDPEGFEPSAFSVPLRRDSQLRHGPLFC